ncbi:MAG: hypothetical protein OXC03_07145 [Flavobacteriaceae bacterium]|nr:hypothetical protein [Flavobacteriaceae bacterium]
MHFKTFLKGRIKKKKYTFSFSELEQYGIPPLSEKEIDDYTRKEYIQPLLKDFSLIIPPEEKGMAQIPFIYYIEDFGIFLNDKNSYYVSYFTASKYHSASHQRVYTDFLNIKNENPVLKEKYIQYEQNNDSDTFRLEKEKYRIKVYINDAFPPKYKSKIPIKTLAPIPKNSFYFRWPKSSLSPVYKTNRKNIWRKEFSKDGHGFNFSSPALTAADLIHERRHGGINDVLSNIEELTSEMSVKDIEELISWYPHKCTLQRLGFLLELLPRRIFKIYNNKHLYQPIKDHLFKNGFPRVLLSKDSNLGRSNYIDRQKNENIKKIALKWNMNVTFILDNDLDCFSYTSPDKVEFYAY